MLRDATGVATDQQTEVNIERDGPLLNSMSQGLCNSSSSSTTRYKY